MSSQGSPSSRQTTKATPIVPISRRIKLEASPSPTSQHATERVCWGPSGAGIDRDWEVRKEKVKQTPEFAVILKDMRTSAFETHETRWRRIIKRLNSPEHERKAAVGAMMGFRFEDMPWPAFGILYYRKRGREEISIASLAMEEMLASDYLGCSRPGDDAGDINKELCPAHFPLTSEGVNNFLDHPERKEVRKRIGMSMPYSATDLSGPKSPETIIQAELCRWQKIRDRTAELVDPGHLDAVNAAIALVCALLAGAKGEAIDVLKDNLWKCSLSA